MPYDGELLNQCQADIDFTLTQAVVVSGASWNPCGHMLLGLSTLCPRHCAGQRTIFLRVQVSEFIPLPTTNGWPGIR